MGGQRIDDHKFWAGSRSKESPLPMQSKMKQESSAEGAGTLHDYEDTTSAIKAVQENSERHIRKHAQKAGYRY